MAVKIQFRRGTAAEWTAVNPTLAIGELGYEVDTQQFKIGNGTANWTTLSYAAVSSSALETAVENAVSSVVGLAPETLDTLQELAEALGDNPNIVATITAAYEQADQDLLAEVTSNYEDAISAQATVTSQEISDEIDSALGVHNGDTTNVHGIADTSLLETTSGAQAKADAAVATANLYTDGKVADLVASAPGTLDTLNELAAALGDDENFSTTVSTSLGQRISFVADTAANFTSANSVLDANTFGIETDTGKFKIGNGVTSWTSLAYGAVLSSELEGSIESAIDTVETSLSEHANDTSAHSIDITVETAISTHNSDTTNVHGIANTEDLVTVDTIGSLIETPISNAITTHKNSSTNVHGIADTSLLVTTTELENHTDATTSVHGIADTSLLVTTTELENHTDATTNVHGIADTSLLVTEGVLSSHTTATTNVHGIPDTSVLVTTEDLELGLDEKAPKNNPTFVGTVVLPTLTSIGDVSDTEIGYLNGTTSNIQIQIDAKLDSSVASTTYAPISNATLTGTVSLPSDTSIGSVSSIEISHLEDSTSNIQEQLDEKAPLESPTFTGTVSGITKGMVGLGSVDNTSDTDKPISTATQTALDAKLALAGGTMTGKITLDGDPTQALHATTKQYVDNVASGILAKPAVYAATTANLTATYDNGTDGVGATLTATSNGAFPVVDGVQLTTANGTRGLLVKNQSNAFENGRYNLTTLGDANTPWVLTRCGLCDTADEIPGMYVFVTDGTTNEGTGWVGYVSDPTTYEVGTDSVSFFQFAGSGAITAGNNISVVGNQVSLVDAPIFTDTITVSSEGIEFSDGTVQTSAGVASLTGFTEKTANYTLDTLDHKDNVIEVNSSSATTITIPANATLAWPVGASFDILQTGSGEVTIAAAGGVTINSTPGLKLRTQWSSATLLKRASNSWIAYGDLKA